MKVARWLALVVFTAALLGCGKPATPDKNSKVTPKKEEDKTKKDKETVKVDPPKEKEKAKEKEKTPDPAPVAGGPKEAMEQLVQGLVDNKPQVIWTALPAKYQADVKDVMTSFASKMDPEVYNKTFATLRKGVAVLKAQKKNILALAKEADGAVPQLPPDALAKATESYDQTVDVLATVANSELANLEDLKKADVEKMLSGSAAKIVDQITAIAQKSGAPPVAELRKSLKIELIKAEGDQAVLKFTADDKTRDVEMVKFEGKWLPKKMVDQWPDTIAKIKENIDMINPDNIKMFKPMILKVLAAADTELGKLEKAKSPDDLKKSAMEALGNIMAATGAQ